MLVKAPQNLGLTAFKRFTIDIDPVTDVERYLTQAGYNYKTGEYAPYDSTSWGPGDRRVLFSTGPINLAPDSTATYWYAVIGSPFGDSGQVPSPRDTSELAKRCKWAREYFDQRLAGIAEETPYRPTGAAEANAATIVRGILFLPPSRLSPPSSLLSIDGRKVLDLHSGANDVSLLCPGVYFVREEPQAASR
jgi:hypothetical protein